jgi:hypothetical protein
MATPDEAAMSTKRNAALNAYDLQFPTSGWAYLRVLEGDRPVINPSKVHFVEYIENDEWLSLCGLVQQGKCQPVFTRFAREDEFCKGCVRILLSRE